MRRWHLHKNIVTCHQAAKLPRLSSPGDGQRGAAEELQWNELLNTKWLKGGKIAERSRDCAMKQIFFFSVVAFLLS